jgi:hypothetical protein
MRGGLEYRHERAARILAHERLHDQAKLHSIIIEMD